MTKCSKWPIGVCSWSVNNDQQLLNALKTDFGIEHVHLALAPAKANKDCLASFTDSGWTISAAMIDFEQEDYSTLSAIRKTGGIVPDNCWQQNYQLVEWAIETTAKLGVEYLSFHLGFIELDDKEYLDKLLSRAKALADIAKTNGVTILLESGQETAETLHDFLTMLNHPSAAVNFDPANMILYGKGNPVDAVKLLARWIKHVHIKDAIVPKTKGDWGSEVVWGSGQVNPEKFLKSLKENNFSGTVAIERESGNDRVSDIKKTITSLSEYC